MVARRVRAYTYIIFFLRSQTFDNLGRLLLFGSRVLDDVLKVFVSSDLDLYSLDLLLVLIAYLLPFYGDLLFPGFRLGNFHSRKINNLSRS